MPNTKLDENYVSVHLTQEKIPAKFSFCLSRFDDVRIGLISGIGKDLVAVYHECFLLSTTLI